MKEINPKNGERAGPSAAGGLCSLLRLLVRRACSLLKVARSELNYRSRCEERDVPVMNAMRQLAQHHPRYRYRRI